VGRPRSSHPIAEREPNRRGPSIPARRSASFQALGAELGAHPTAVYRHFRDKDELTLGSSTR
jgi:Bacterial regulatory proteins, tetR family